MNKKNSLLVIFSILLIIFSTEKLWAQKNQVYHGQIYNIFFHPLIVYPELAFNRKDDRLNYMDAWFVTINEFKKIIPELYKRGFVLVSPKDLFEEKNYVNGRLIYSRKQLILPEGKKPLILSLDDYNYYTNMKLHGTIHRFWVDQQGRLLTITNQKNAPAIIRDDQEVPQLLEKFIAAHPDFSYNHARGIIGLTGYNGIFGYDTQKLSSPDYQAQLSEAKRVVQKLKEMGWQFASHSYFHLSEKKLAGLAFEISEKRWFREVGSIIGPTPYYIFPFGEAWDNNPARMKFLKALGFKYFFGVAQINNLTLGHGFLVMDRFPMDGGALRGKYSHAKVYMNSAEILDSARIINHSHHFINGI